MPRPSNTSIRRQEIIQGLMIVMSDVGYEGATMPLIARAAGLTPGVIHYHFESKQAILIGLIDNLGESVEKRFQSFAQESGGEAQLKGFIEAHVGLGRGADPRAVACWIAIGAEAVRQPEVRAQYQRFTETQLSTLEQICSKALVDSGRSVKKKREIALGIMCAIEGAYRLLVSAPDLIVPGFAAPTITNMALGLIAAQPEAKQRR